jgi:hypothetical protein
MTNDFLPWNLDLMDFQSCIFLNPEKLLVPHLALDSDFPFLIWHSATISIRSLLSVTFATVKWLEDNYFSNISKIC